MAAEVFVKIAKRSACRKLKVKEIYLFTVGEIILRVMYPTRVKKEKLIRKKRL